MDVVGQIRELKDRALAELDAIHDYYTDTKLAWRILHEFVRNGHKVTSRNKTTGTITNETELAAKSRGYIAKQLAEATFQQFVLVFENFLFGIIRSWLLSFPGRLGSKDLKFQRLLDTPNLEEIKLYIVNREVNQTAYDRPQNWFKYLEEEVGLKFASQGDIDQFVEAKASRDLLVHNGGIANALYESKAGRMARFNDGQLIDIPESYHQNTFRLMKKMIDDLMIAVENKFA